MALGMERGGWTPHQIKRLLREREYLAGRVGICEPARVEIKQANCLAQFQRFTEPVAVRPMCDENAVEVAFAT